MGIGLLGVFKVKSTVRQSDSESYTISAMQYASQKGGEGNVIKSLVFRVPVWLSWWSM